MVVGSEITFLLYNHKFESCEMNPCDEITTDPRNKQDLLQKIATLFRIASHSCETSHSRLQRSSVIAQRSCMHKPWGCICFMHKLLSSTRHYLMEKVCIFQVSNKMVSAAHIENNFILLLFSKFVSLTKKLPIKN